MDSWRSLQRAVFFSVVPLALGACSGAMGAFAPHMAATSQPASAKTTSVSFTLHIPGSTGSARRRKPDYVSMGTNSASITVTGGAAEAAPAPATILDCTSSQTCTANLVAPIGNDTFAVTLYSGTNAGGSILGIGKTTQTIVLDKANQVLVTLDGVVDSIALSVNPATLPAGTMATQTVSVNALDAAGYTIVAPGGYVDVNDNPLKITVSKLDYGNGKGVTTLTAPTTGGANVTGPDGSLTYTYNGSDIDETSYTSTTSSTIAGAQGEADVTYVPTYIKKYSDTASADTNFITAGPDGNLWFTDYGTGTVGSIVPATGVITHYMIPTTLSNGSAEPEAIVAGPNDMMYFAEYNGGTGFGAIGSISTTAAATTAAATPVVEIPLTTTNANPRGIAYDNVCDTGIWFTEFNGNKIGVLSTTTMAVTEYTVPTAASQPDQIACGDDGNFWFTEYAGDKIGQITPAGVIKEFSFPSSGVHAPSGITKGADGAMWIAESTGNAIARVVTSKTVPAGAVGSVIEYPLPPIVSPGGTSRLPSVITSAPDGDLFFSEFNSENQTQNSMIGRITTTSAAAPNQPAPASGPPVVGLTSYPLDDVANMPYGITVGPDGHIWYVEMGSGAIGYLVY